VTTYVGLLRGVNVGGHNKLPMARLRELAAEVGEDVQTYLQSGNVVLRSGAKAADVRAALEERLATELGKPATALVLTAAQLRRVRDGNPFPDERDPTKLHVVFLAERPPAAKLKAFDPEAWAPEELRVAGTTAYLHLPDGLGRSKLAAAVGKLLGVAGTARNWRTVEALVELSG
jgi:uncharacterized protein (DUF1697 family)